MNSDASGAEAPTATADRPGSDVSEGAVEADAGAPEIVRTRRTSGPRVVVFGNAGSGKSTYANQLSREEGLVHLDLDTIVWEPGKVAIPRPTSVVHADLRRFLEEEERWVIEGCYSEWVEVASVRCTQLVFLNPGEAACMAHCRARPWEPRKYRTLEEQNRMLSFLLEWVRAYYTRDDSCSLARHRRVFEEFGGAKREFTTPSSFRTSEANPSTQGQ